MAQDLNKEISTEMAFKWLAIPLSVLIILTSGEPYNLFNYFEDISRDQGYNTIARTSFEYVILIGYFFGIIPGILVDESLAHISFIISGVIAIITYPTLGYLVSNGTSDEIIHNILI